MRILLIYLEALKNEPIGLMYIGTALKNQSHEVKIIGWEKNNPLGGILKEVFSFKPAIAGISINTALSDNAQAAAAAIKRSFPGIMVVAGGPHATILPYETLKDRHVDTCVMGEGEITAVELVKAMELKMPLEKIKGLSFLKDNALVTTEKREYIQDLDTLPFVDRALMPRKVVYGRAGYPLGNPCMLFSATRGCPYQCSFCQPTLNKMFGNKIRRRSPKNVVEEIMGLKNKYGVRGLSFNDDTFLFDNRWVEHFCDLMIKEGAGVLWYANGRLNKPDRGILKKMRDAGCVGLVMTPETGSCRIRNEVLNKKISDEEIEEAYSACHEVGLPTQANIMLATPTETEDELESSIKLIKKIQPHFMNFSYTTALPGTYLYEAYQKEISTCPQYKDCSGYDIGEFKNLHTSIPDGRLRQAWSFFERFYSKSSLSNRARHFIEFPYFRRILFKRWRSLIFSRHANIKHFVFDIAAILLGSIDYFRHRIIYKRQV